MREGGEQIWRRGEGEEGEERWLEGREGGEGKGGCEWRERE